MATSSAATIGARHRSPDHPITRQAFRTVPLRSFDLLWLDRHYRGTIELRDDAGWSVTMEFIAATRSEALINATHRRELPVE